MKYNPPAPIPSEPIDIVPWHQKHDKQKEQEYMTNRYKEILQELQNDIDTYKERNNVS